MGRFPFAVAVFVGALLLFQVQPLVAKRLLPWYGGIATVWTTCLVVFQVLLFAGYAYAHAMVRWLGLARQTLVHGALLLTACLLPAAPGERWAPRGDEDPILSIVGTLLPTVGPRYFVLAATAPLLQVWFGRLFPERSPYPLYALSNAGSMLALLSYPFLVEPMLAWSSQAGLWKGLFWLFALACGSSAWLAYRGGSRKPVERPADRRPPPARGRPLSWLGWSACGVILFMAVTNQLSAEMAAVPFLWIVPLSVYLLTFILAFSGERWYPRGLLTILTLPALAGIYLAVQSAATPGEELRWLGFPQQFLALTAGLFVLCMVCHGELYRLRPGASSLTRFYLLIALGGVAGGAVVGVLAPRVMLLSQELHAGVLLCLALLLAGRFSDPSSRLRRGRPRWAWGLLLAGWIAAASVAWLQSAQLLEHAVQVRRNPYGLLRLVELRQVEPSMRHRRLYHGSTLHGAQFLEPGRRREPTTYYTTGGGGGAVLSLFRPSAPRRVGFVGLGVGTMATYGRRGDWFKFYEIDPDVVELARDEFTYLADSRARWEVRVGDARLILAREPPQRFDVLVLDAFSGGAVPVHLLTLEAFKVYARHMAPGGVIAVHVSNRELDLTPVLYNVADARGLRALTVVTRRESPGFLLLRSKWVILTGNTEFLGELIAHFGPWNESGEVGLFQGDPTRYARIRAWTDDYSNLVQLLD